MEEFFYYSALYDYYGSLLTKTQQDYFTEYYFNNLSLQEIADNYNVSKNAVSKSIKETKDKLDYWEDNLMLYLKKRKIERLLSKEEFERIQKYL